MSSQPGFLDTALCPQPKCDCPGTLCGERMEATKTKENRASLQILSSLQIQEEILFYQFTLRNAVEQDTSFLLGTLEPSS